MTEQEKTEKYIEDLTNVSVNSITGIMINEDSNIKLVFKQALTQALNDKGEACERVYIDMTQAKMKTEDNIHVAIRNAPPQIKEKKVKV